MKRLFRVAIGFLILLGILVFASYVLYERLPHLVATQIEKRLGVPVSIQAIQLRSELIGVDGIVIENLPNRRLTTAFSAEKTRIHAPLLDYRDKTVHIHQIHIDQVYLGLEFDSTKSTEGNWSALMKNLESSSGTTTEGQTVIIEELILTNIQVEIAYTSKDGSIKKLPIIDKIVLTNINSSQGLPMDQVLKSVLGQMLKSVFLKENIKDMLQGIIDTPKNSIDTLLSPFKNLFGS